MLKNMVFFEQDTLDSGVRSRCHRVQLHNVGQPAILPGRQAGLPGALLCTGPVRGEFTDELIVAKILKRLLNFLIGIHYKGTVLSDGFIDRFAAQYQCPGTRG